MRCSMWRTHGTGDKERGGYNLKVKKLVSRAMAGVALSALLMTPCIAEESTPGQQTTSIPVTLTIVNSIKNIDVTMPAAFPVSVVDGKVLTATNVEIKNNSEKMGVEIVSVKVTDGTYSVSNYEAFPSLGSKKIALSINGCPTRGAGELGITKQAFPNIDPTQSLAIDYDAKVLGADEVKGERAANVIFTLRAIKD